MNALFDRAIAILKAMPVIQFVVVLPDGTEIRQGNLQLLKRKRRNSKYPPGTVSTHYKPHLATLKPGILVDISFDKFEPETLRSSISAYCVQNWGKGSFMTAINRSKQCIEVLRLA